MLDRFFNSSGFAFGFIFFVVVLLAVYLVNRERAQVQRLKGPSRFAPKWTGRRDGRPSGRSGGGRRRRHGSGFRPQWSSRRAEPRTGEGAPGEDAARDDGPSSSG